MIRKTLLIVLALATLCSCVAWGFSYVGITVGHTAYKKSRQGPDQPDSLRIANAMVRKGNLSVGWHELPDAIISHSAFPKKIADPGLGWDLEVGEREVEAGIPMLKRIPDRTMMYIVGEPWWYPNVRRGAAGTIVTIPLWQTTAALGVWPFIALILGPLRRGIQQRRLRRMGLCVQCGYDLTDNESGVCPECGKETQIEV